MSLFSLSTWSIFWAGWVKGIILRWSSSHEHLPLLISYNLFRFHNVKTCFLCIHLFNKYHSTLRHCLLNNVVAAGLRTHA